MMIGEKIKFTRENKGLSREYIAGVLDIDVRTYEKIEHNKRDLQLSEVEKIAQALNLSISELLFGEPRLVFENCNQNGSVYGGGTVYYQSVEEIKGVYEALVEALKENIKDKEKMIEILSSRK